MMKNKQQIIAEIKKPLNESSNGTRTHETPSGIKIDVTQPPKAK